MTIFDYIKDITTFKKGTLILDDYIPFLINRWLSFISPQTCKGINESVNVLGNIDKNFHYKLLLTLYPKTKIPYINYIKKVKDKKNKDEDQIPALAKNIEVSQREIKLMLELKEQLT